MEKVCRCGWVNLKNPLYVEYHDREWGRPEHEDGKLCEMLILESFQAGLSWECVLNKRENFRRAFDGFAPQRVARFDEEKVQQLLCNPGIIRNSRKIRASIRNCAVFLEIQREFGSFDRYLWSFTGGEVVREDCTLRTTSPLSDALSRDLKRRGMSFVGSTVVYSYLQAVGVINGHSAGCFCLEQ